MKQNKPITYNEVMQRLKNKKLEDMKSQDIFDRYIAYGTEEELNTPEIQQALIHYGYVKTLMEMVNFITDKQVIADILKSELLKNENILTMQGQAKLWIIEHLQEPRERTLSFEFIDKDTGERIILEGPTMFSQEEYNQYRNQFFKYQNNLIAIVEKDGNQYKLLCFLISS